MPCQGTGSCMCWKHILSTCRDGVHLGWVEDFVDVFVVARSLVFAGFTNSHVTNYSYLFSLVLSSDQIWMAFLVQRCISLSMGDQFTPCLVWFLRSGYASRFAQTLRSILQQRGHLCRGLEWTSWDTGYKTPGVKLVQLFDAWSFHWAAYLLRQKCQHQSCSGLTSGCRAVRQGPRPNSISTWRCRRWQTASLFCSLKKRYISQWFGIFVTAM